MALRDGYVECALVWRVHMEQVGSSWTGHLTNPLNEIVETWLNQAGPENVFGQACEALLSRGRDVEVSMLRLQWAEMRP